MGNETRLQSSRTTEAPANAERELPSTYFPTAQSRWREEASAAYAGERGPRELIKAFEQATASMPPFTSGEVNRFVQAYFRSDPKNAMRNIWGAVNKFGIPLGTENAWSKSLEWLGRETNLHALAQVSPRDIPRTADDFFTRFPEEAGSNISELLWRPDQFTKEQRQAWGLELAGQPLKRILSQSQDGGGAIQVPAGYDAGLVDQVARQMANTPDERTGRLKPLTIKSPEGTVTRYVPDSASSVEVAAQAYQLSAANEGGPVEVRYRGLSLTANNKLTGELLHNRPDTNLQLLDKIQRSYFETMEQKLRVRRNDFLDSGARTFGAEGYGHGTKSRIAGLAFVTITVGGAIYNLIEPRSATAEQGTPVIEGR